MAVSRYHRINEASRSLCTSLDSLASLDQYSFDSPRDSPYQFTLLRKLATPLEPQPFASPVSWVPAQFEVIGQITSPEEEVRPFPVDENYPIDRILAGWIGPRAGSQDLWQRYMRGLTRLLLLISPTLEEDIDFQYFTEKKLKPGVVHNVNRIRVLQTDDVPGQASHQVGCVPMILSDFVFG